MVKSGRNSPLCPPPLESKHVENVTNFCLPGTHVPLIAQALPLSAQQTIRDKCAKEHLSPPRPPGQIHGTSLSRLVGTMHVILFVNLLGDPFESRPRV